MDERGANIDLVFRNGLKDFEVLPPSDVWENLQPVIIRKQRSVALLRVAAMITILISMSLFAYWWSGKISTQLDSSALALNEVPSIPENVPLKSVPVNTSVEAGVIKQNSSIEIVDVTANDTEDQIVDNINSQQVTTFQEPKVMPSDNSVLMKGPKQAASNSFLNPLFEMSEINESLIPVEVNKQESNRWSIGALASPTYYSKFNQRSDELSQQLRASEQPLISYTGGVAFSYKINKRFSIQSGLFYSSVGQEVSGISSYGGFQKYDNTKGDRNFEVLTTNGTVYTNNSDVFLIAEGPSARVLTSFTNDVFDPVKANLDYFNNNLFQNFSYLEFPVSLKYKLVDKVLDFNIIGGISYNMLINNSVYTMVDGGKYSIGKTDGLNFITISSSLGMGMEYSFSNNLSLNLEPTLRYYLNPFSQMGNSSSHIYSFGIFSGISYKF